MHLLGRLFQLLKWFVPGLLLAILLVSVSLSVFPGLLRTPLESVASDIAQQPVAIRGPIVVIIAPSPKLGLEQVTIGPDSRPLMRLQRVRLGVDLPRLLFSGRTLERLPFTLEAESGPLWIGLDGTVMDSGSDAWLEADGELRGDDLADLEPLSGLDMPHLGPFRISARVQASSQWIRLHDLRAELGRNLLTGDLTLQWEGRLQEVNGELEMQRLSLVELRSQLPQSASASAPVGAERIIPDLPIPGLLPLSTRGTVTLRVHELAARERDIGSAVVRLALEAQRISVKPELELFDGTEVSADLEFREEGGVQWLQYRLQIVDLNYGALLRRLELSDRVEGHLGLEFDLRGTGDGLHQLLAGSDGHLRIVGGPGELPSSVFKVWGGDLAQLLLPTSWDGEAPARLECLLGDFTITAGWMESNLLLVDTAQVSVLGDLQLDLENESLSGRLQPVRKRASLVRLDDPVKVSGSLARPRVAPAPGRTLTTLGLVVLGVANPAALIPLLGGLGSGADDLCAQVLDPHSEGTDLTIEDVGLRGALDGLMKRLATAQGAEK